MSNWKKNEWKKEMDALYEHTRKNWAKTGLRVYALGVTGKVHLGDKDAREEKKTLDKPERTC